MVKIKTYKTLITVAIILAAVEIVINLLIRFVIGFPSPPSKTATSAWQILSYLIYGSSPDISIHVIIAFTLIALSAAIFAISLRRGVWDYTLSAVCLILIVGASVWGWNLFESAFDAIIFGFAQNITFATVLVLYAVLLRHTKRFPNERSASR